MTMTLIKISNKATFRETKYIMTLFMSISQTNRQQILAKLEKQKWYFSNFQNYDLSEFYIKMFKEMVSCEAKQLHIFLFHGGFLKQIQNINLVNLQVLNLLDCSIDNIETLNFLNTNFLKRLFLRNNQIYRMKTLAKCLPANEIKTILIQKSPIQLINEGQLFKKLQFKSRDLFNVFVYVRNDAMIQYDRHRQRLKYRYYWRIPKRFEGYKLNFNQQYRKYQKQFYFSQKEEVQHQNQNQN